MMEQLVWILNAVIWNLESGYIKAVLKEPLLDLRTKQEKPVEKVLFLPAIGKNTPLLSCHADGCLRVWDVSQSKMMAEV